MAGGFVGRQHELAELNDLLDRVRAGGRTGRPGRAVLIRGRRRVGKSRLVEEFAQRASLPHVFFTATGAPRDEELANFAAEVAASDLPDAARFADFAAPQTWGAALALLASILPTDQPSMVVFDEMPYLAKEDPSFEGTLQKAFDRTLSRLPVLLVLIGSGLAMMEALNTYGRPFYQRGTEMTVPPLNPAEFPAEAQARTVLGAIGHGERTFTLIGRAAGGLNPDALSRSLDILTSKRLVEARLPLSTQPSKDTRCYVADPYLRFWLSFIGPGMPAIERGRGDHVLATVKKKWNSWRGRAVEPVIRQSLLRLSDGTLPEGTEAVGGYWTRSNNPEIDIVGADRAPIAKKITVVGSIKWLENNPLDGHDLTRLIIHRGQLPGADDTTPLLPSPVPSPPRPGSLSSGPTTCSPRGKVAQPTSRPYGEQDRMEARLGYQRHDRTKEGPQT